MTDDDASVAGSITGLQVTSKSLMNDVAQERVLGFLEACNAGLDPGIVRAA